MSFRIDFNNRMISGEKSERLIETVYKTQIALQNY